VTIFEGQCERGLRHGPGVTIYKYNDIAHNSIIGQASKLTQRKYIGEYANNMPNGYGTMIYENGTKFVGFFKDGERVGLGV
jgi:hypothetical protein